VLRRHERRRRRTRVGAGLRTAQAAIDVRSASSLPASPGIDNPLRLTAPRRDRTVSQRSVPPTHDLRQRRRAVARPTVQPPDGPRCRWASSKSMSDLFASLPLRFREQAKRLVFRRGIDAHPLGCCRRGLDDLFAAAGWLLRHRAGARALSRWRDRRLLGCVRAAWKARLRASRGTYGAIHQAGSAVSARPSWPARFSRRGCGLDQTPDRQPATSMSGWGKDISGRRVASSVHENLAPDTAEPAVASQTARGSWHMRMPSRAAM
jgi:hypothetical protein